MENQPSPSVSPRKVYVIIVLVALGIVTGKIATVLSRDGETPFLSANDRSRWCTVAALVENGTYQIDPFLKRRGSKQNRRPWHTIDLVRHVGEDGQLHYYSSKPPLLPTMISWVYWGSVRVFQMWLSDQPITMGRILLWIVNIPILVAFFGFTLASIDRLIRDTWSKYLMAAAVCFGTMLMPFSIALNNHLPAAASCAIAVWILLKSLDGKLGILWSCMAGLAAGFLAANELPALSLTVFWALWLAVSNGKAFIGYCIGVAIVGAAFFACNWNAHGSLKPPYMHRGNGALIATLPSADPVSVRQTLAQHSFAESNSEIELSDSRQENRQRVVIDRARQFALVETESGRFELRHWDDWYDYPSSYWVEGRRRGVDRGEPSRLVYLANMTFGHYGVFSLTPFWLLMPVGFLILLTSGSKESKLFFACIALSTLICGTFYVMRPEIDRNYGGVSVCFRWLLWFAPTWLLASAAAVDRISQAPAGRVTAMSLLALSIASMAASLASPFQSPWLYRFCEFLGLVEP